MHDPEVTWLAGWKENVMDGHKYVFLAASSSFKGKSDMAKYDKVSQRRPTSPSQWLCFFVSVHVCCQLYPSVR